MAIFHGSIVRFVSCMYDASERLTHGYMMNNAERTLITKMTRDALGRIYLIIIDVVDIPGCSVRYM